MILIIIVRSGGYFRKFLEQSEVDKGKCNVIFKAISTLEKVYD